jgi:uncharacterized protein YbjQ (UPF0145 family)
MDEVPIEKIDLFETLEEYAISNPAPEIPISNDPIDPEPPSEDLNINPFAENLPDSLKGALDSDLNLTPEGSSLDFATTPADPLPSEDLNPSFEIGEPVSDPFASPSESELTPPAAPDFLAQSAMSDIEAPEFPLSSQDQNQVQEEPQIASQPEAEAPTPQAPAEVQSPTPTPEPTPPKKLETPMEKVKKFSASVNASKSAVPAAYPFSLLITGPLSPEEKEKLLDLLSRENMGFREIDLEPQFESNRILLPRMSEYAGVLLVQALRGTRAEIKLGPSDTIFSTAETRADEHESATEGEETSSKNSTEYSHPAENLPMTTEDSLPGLPHLQAIDTITASAALHSGVAEAEKSTEYQDLADALQRELKYKAYRKGADGIIHYKIQLNNLLSPMHYRLVAMGTAVKSKSTQKDPMTPESATPLVGSAQAGAEQDEIASKDLDNPFEDIDESLVQELLKSSDFDPAN